jgi:hypothetical protein
VLTAEESRTISWRFWAPGLPPGLSCPLSTPMVAPSTTRPHRLSTRCDICVSCSPPWLPCIHALRRLSIGTSSPTISCASFRPTVPSASSLPTLAWANTQTAPEIYAKVVTQDAERYTVGVDIWSLAIVFAKRAGGLPDYQGSYKKSTTAWNKAVVIGALVVSAGGTQRADPVSPR